MKTPFPLLALVCLLIGAGCSTPCSVAKLEGQGTRHLFDAQYDPVWNAVLGAVEMNDLQVVQIDTASGHISARRVMGVTTFGENVSIWVRAVAPGETEVEVISRRTGPPVMPTPRPEKSILQTVADVLT